MPRLRVAFAVVIVLGAACNGENATSEVDRTRVSNETDDNTVTDKKDAEVAEGNARETDLANGDVVSLGDLKEAIARHKDTSRWYYGERPDGEPTGTWLSEDEDKEPLIFEKDGSFKCGFIWRKGTGHYAAGRYSISEKGLIVAVAKHNGVRFGPFYNLEAGRIIGSRGPSPRVEWKRTNAVEE